MPKNSFGFTFIKAGRLEQVQWRSSFDSLKPFGFTLIELLVSIAVIAVLSTVGFIEYRTFSANQILNSSVNDVQSFLRVAQSNATAAVTLTNGGTNYPCKNWVARFSRIDGKDTLDLICEEAVEANYQDHLKANSTLILPTNITISAVDNSCTDSDPPPALPLSFPTDSLSVAFRALYGKPSIIMARNTASECISKTYMTVTIQYSQGTTTISKDITISRGGRIDAE